MPFQKGHKHAKGRPAGSSNKATTKIIFTTAHRDYAVEGFELQAIDYVLKPISLERLLSAVNLFLSYHSVPKAINTDETFIFIRVDRKMVKLFLSEILYGESHF